MIAGHCHLSPLWSHERIIPALGLYRRPARAASMAISVFCPVHQPESVPKAIMTMNPRSWVPLWYAALRGAVNRVASSSHFGSLVYSYMNHSSPGKNRVNRRTPSLVSRPCSLFRAHQRSLSFIFDPRIVFDNPSCQFGLERCVPAEVSSLSRCSSFVERARVESRHASNITGRINRLMFGKTYFMRVVLFCNKLLLETCYLNELQQFGKRVLSFSCARGTFTAGFRCHYFQ